MNGDFLSSTVLEVARIVGLTSVTARDVDLLAILGFSALLTGGGAVLKLLEGSRRISPDRRGGGGDGGRDGCNLGDFVEPESIRGV